MILQNFLILFLYFAEFFSQIGRETLLRLATVPRWRPRNLAAEKCQNKNKRRNFICDIIKQN